MAINSIQRTPLQEYCFMIDNYPLFWLSFLCNSYCLTCDSHWGMSYHFAQRHPSIICLVHNSRQKIYENKDIRQLLAKVVEHLLGVKK